MGKRKTTSTNSLNLKKLIDFCGMIYAVDILGGRWKLLILYKLGNKTLRYNQLKKLIPAITDRMLTLHLQELEKNSLITRTAFAEVPPRVEYYLTESGRQLIPIWQQLELWGLQHRTLMENAKHAPANVPEDIV